MLNKNQINLLADRILNRIDSNKDISEVEKLFAELSTKTFITGIQEYEKLLNEINNQQNHVD